MTIEKKGSKKTESQIEKMREIKRDQWADPEWRAWNSEQIRKASAREDVKEKVRLSHFGKKQTIEHRRNLSEAKGGRRRKLMPHLVRNIPVSEIQIAESEFTTQKIYYGYNFYRKTGELKRPTPEEISEKLRKAQLGRKGRKKEFSPDQLKRAEFAGKLREEGLIGEDISNWMSLHAMYANHGREFPREIGMIGREILEVFMVGTKKAYEGDSSIRDSYISLGNEFDPELFDVDNALYEEHIFIRDTITADRKKNGIGRVIFSRDITNSMVVYGEIKVGES